VRSASVIVEALRQRMSGFNEPQLIVGIPVYKPYYASHASQRPVFSCGVVQLILMWSQKQLSGVAERLLVDQCLAYLNRCEDR
jgi:hypothetical protein